MGLWFWIFVVWFVISTNLLTFLLTYLFLQKKMYLLAVREIILLMGGRGSEKTEKTERKSEVEKKESQQEETGKQETPHSFSASSLSPQQFSLQDLLLRKKVNK
jgi:hypothetical protein